ncbi:hypothetical protein ASG51_16520 [Methylobacterium sp. Leaf465]|nr:hypothetical protein ASG51_16520 [Methylobacterium sp. Leaf465]
MSQTLQGDATALSAVALARPAQDAVHRAVWRWHFYAGLLCLPFLVLLVRRQHLWDRLRVFTNGGWLVHRSP